MGWLFKKIIRHIASLTGLNTHNLRLLETVQRPQWLYRADHTIPKYSLYFEQTKSTAEDVGVCIRLIAAYERASDEKITGTSTDIISKTNGIWTGILNSNYSQLLTVLNKKNPEELAKLLALMFQQKFMTGIATGVLHASGHNRFSEKLWSLKFINGLVSLAEFLGVVRTECPEQGMIGYALREGVEPLIKNIEEKLRISIDVPRIGSPHGIEILGKLITSDSPEHIYVAARASQIMNVFLDADQQKRPAVVEIGAGYGSAAYWLLQLNQAITSYTIIDLPLVNILQGYFLSKSLGEDVVSLYGEKEKKVQVLPTHSIKIPRTIPFDFLINENSMPEMPESAVEGYLRWVTNNCRGVFFSYNQETYSCFQGVPQVLVPEVIKSVGGYQLLTRSPSWLRRGYVEEVYRCLHN